MHAGEPILPGDGERLKHVARYITRTPLRLDSVTRIDGDRVTLRTPIDPRTGRQKLALDSMELIRRLCGQIPAPRRHLVRYYGWYSHRSHGARSVNDRWQGRWTRRARRGSGLDLRAGEGFTLHYS